MTARGPLLAQGERAGTALGSVHFQHPQLWRRLASYVETLTIGQGRRAGQSFELYPWQRRFLRGAFSQDDDAALSIARGAGKTTFCAAICCAAVDVGGPLVEPMGETILVASSFEQALICFRHIRHFLQPTLDKFPRRYSVQDSVNRARILDRETGAVVRVLGSDPDRLHGLAPRLLLYDEVSQWPQTRVDRMLAALETSRGKIPGSRALWVGTRPASPDHPFEKALQGGVGYAQIHAARPADPPFRRSTWRKANPGLDLQPDLMLALQQEAGRAKRDPQQLASFKALRLNMGVADTVEALVMEADVWSGIETSTPLPVGPYVLGIDLGQNAAMSAAAAYWPTSGYLDSFAVFPENPSLAERGLNDGVGAVYGRMAERGELLQAGGRVSDVRALLNEALDRWGTPAAIVCDSWRRPELIGHLETTGFPLVDLVTRRQGWQDGGEDLRAFRTAALDGHLVPSVSLLMRAAMTSARTTSDASGNTKLAKAVEGRRKGSRDDAVSAAILAVAEGRRRAAAPAPALDYAIV